MVGAASRTTRFGNFCHSSRYSLNLPVWAVTLKEIRERDMDPQADGYYEEPEVNSGELDLSFLDEDEDKK